MPTAGSLHTSHPVSIPAAGASLALSAACQGLEDLETAVLSGRLVTKLVTNGPGRVGQRRTWWDWARDEGACPGTWAYPLDAVHEVEGLVHASEWGFKSPLRHT